MIIVNRTKDFLTDNLSFSRKTVKKGTEFSIHWHEYIELEIILSGEGFQNRNGEEYEISVGMATFISGYDFHGLKAKTDMEIINISFGEDLLDKEITDSINLRCSGFKAEFSERELGIIVNKYDKIIYERDSNMPYAKTMIKMLINEIAVMFLRKSNTGDNICQPKIIQKAKRYAADNFTKNISLFDTAAYLGLTPNYFGLLFKKSTGESFNGYLNSVRLRYACSLLLNKDITVKETAFSSGYGSVEYFISVFRKYIGMTPGAYRKKMLK